MNPHAHHIIAAAAAAVYGGVFTWSGATKLVAPDWPNQAREFGTPKWLITSLPGIELLLGAAFATTRVKVLALPLEILLQAFTLAAILHLLAGRRPRCACFGSRSRAPISWLTVARNAALFALGVVAVVV